MNVNTLPPSSSEEIQIHPITYRDVFALYRLEKRCFPIDSWPFIDIVFAMMLSRLTRLKAMIGDQMVGFVIGEKQKEVGWVATFGVDPDFRNKGIGSSLLHEIELELKKPNYRLCVRKSNESAIRLYKRNGYLPVDTWKSYYRGGEDALVMEKRRPILRRPSLH